MDTQDTGRRGRKTTTQKTKKMSNTDPTKTGAEPKRPRRTNSPCD
jgi:hypothetical protein